MAKSKKELAMALSGQASFLDKLERAEPGSLDISLPFRGALSAAFRNCRFSRYQVAATMSELLNRDVSKTMLDAYTAESKEPNRFPAEWLPAVKAATGSLEPLIVIADASDCELLTGEEAVYAQIARLERKEEEIRRKKEILKRHFK